MTFDLDAKINDKYNYLVHFIIIYSTCLVKEKCLILVRYTYYDNNLVHLTDYVKPKGGNCYSLSTTDSRRKRRRRRKKKKKKIKGKKKKKSVER